VAAGGARWRERGWAGSGPRGPVVGLLSSARRSGCHHCGGVAGVAGEEVLGIADVEVMGVVDRDAAAGCGQSPAMLSIARLLKRCMEAAVLPPVEAH
jgi:hypothetical protein